MIKEFFITKLYEERNVRIKFNSPYKILVAENGYGKTTILNSFYALLSGETSKLRKISFEEIGIVFSDGDIISFTKPEFDADLALIKSHPLFEHIETKFGHEFILQLLDDVRRLPLQRMEMSSVFRRVVSELDLPASVLKESLRDIFRDSLRPDMRFRHNNIRENRPKKRVQPSTQDKLEQISKKINLKTLYLPTYRRVEEDIRAFSGSGKGSFNEHVSINFGMHDVQESIEKITSEILSSSVEWFSKINGEMLSQLVSGFLVTPEMKTSIQIQKQLKLYWNVLGNIYLNLRKNKYWT
ncbi:hypothetical protein [Shewanella oncorhynchi]|uniref:hypothetical protein n=1 Tax=Shewanella oncorhynchi TaxID=2726434 RepID=UPI003D792913